MSFYLECWLRGYAKDHLREIARNSEGYHPHITFIRPFELIKTEEVIGTVLDFCDEKPLIPFTLKGKSYFDNNISYVPVINCEQLLNFNNELEEELEGKVNFSKKLNNEKILHATVEFKDPNYVCPDINQYMLRLTGIKDKQIWFSYDFVTREFFNREESLNKKRWHNTVHEFSKQTNLLPTRNGYQKIN